MNIAAGAPPESIRDSVRIMTLQAHMLEAQAQFPQATGTFSWILSALSISAKIIADKVRRARLENVLGSVGTENVQGEVQQKLDVLANDVLMRALGGREGVAIVASEENEEPVILRDDGPGVHRYCVLFDPLDGSSNLDVCGGVGTIFSILRAPDGITSARAEDFLQPGTSTIVDRVLDQVRPGSIIISHDGGGPRAQTLAAYPTIFSRLRSEGYRIVTIPELLGFRDVYVPCIRLCDGIGVRRAAVPKGALIERAP